MVCWTSTRWRLKNTENCNLGLLFQFQSQFTGCSWISHKKLAFFNFPICKMEISLLTHKDIIYINFLDKIL